MTVPIRGAPQLPEMPEMPEMPEVQEAHLDRAALEAILCEIAERASAVELRARELDLAGRVDLQAAAAALCDGRERALQVRYVLDGVVAIDTFLRIEGGGAARVRLVRVLPRG